MKKYIFLSLVVVSQFIAVATAKEQVNKSFVLRGHIVNSVTQEHIPHATVSVNGTAIGVVADGDGHFELKGLPIGQIELKASMVGYSAQDQTLEVSTRGGSCELTFELTEDVMALDQVVVSANRTEIKRRNSPTLVSVMPSQLFNNIGAPTLADGLSYQPGVRIENNCQNCGFTQVRINGLDGHYSQILIDSRPVFSALTGVYGLEQIPANMIDRVEVVRGGGSALFGSSAIGGTVNIITKMPEYNSAEIAHSLTVIGSSSVDNNTTANMSFMSDNQRAGATIFGQVRNRGSYDANGDGFTEIPELESSTIGMRTYFKTGDFSKLSLQYDASQEYRRGGDQLWLPAHQAQVAEQVSHHINGGGVNFDLFSRNYTRKLNLFTSAQKTDRESFYGTFETPEAYGTTDETIFISGAQFSQSWDKLLFMPSEFVGGVEYNYNDLRDEAIDLNHLLEQRVHTLSAYAQNEWRNDKWGFLVGVRADQHTLVDRLILSPRANIRYNPSDNFNFRATYSTGFRAPQTFDEDLHIAVVGGERTVTNLADDLKEESSQSFSLSADMYQTFGRVSANLLVEGFYTILDDAYAIRELGEIDGTNVLERYNGSGATVGGVTLEGRLSLPRVVSFQMAMTYQRSLYDEAEAWSENEDVEATREMFRSPDLYGYFTANFDLTKRLALMTSATYTGSMLVQHCEGSGTDIDMAVRTPSFFDANVKLSYNFPLVAAARMEVYGGVQNIFNAYQSDFDSGFERDPGYIYGPLQPRRFNLGVKLSF